MSTKLFVGRLSYNTTDAQLEEHFAKVGNVVSAKVIMDRYSGQSKGFGFVEMASEEDAQNALNQLHNSELDGRTIVVSEARPQEDRGQRPQEYRSNRR
jgi:RNA recognition motif-containing protein